MMNPPTATAFAPSPWRALGGLWFLQSRMFLNARYWLRTLGLLALLGVLAAYTTDPSNFCDWLSGFYLQCLTAGAIRDDLQPGVGDYLFTRPIRRPVYLGLRYLTKTAALQIEFLLALGALTAIGVYKDAPALLPLLPSLLVAQALMLGVFGAFGLLAAILTRRYALLGLAYGALVEAGLGSVPTTLNQLSMTHQIARLLAPSLADPRAGNALAFFVSRPAWAAFGIVATATFGALALAAVVFSQQERSGGAPEN
jgi:hypothetical protein